LFNFILPVHLLRRAIATKMERWIAPPPLVSHLSLTENMVKSKTIIVGDIHACIDEFRLLLDDCGYDPDTTTLIVAGDFVNKGPDSVGTIRYVKSLGAYCVRGNHDDSALGHLIGTHLRAKDDSYAYINQFTKEEVEWLSQMPYTISLPPSMNAIVVHAGIEPFVELGKQKQQHMVTMRNLHVVTGEGGSNVLLATDSIDIGLPWAMLWGLKKDVIISVLTSDNPERRLKEAWENPENIDPKTPHVYFGHDARRGLQQCHHATGLDTGCVYGRALTAVILPERRFVSVQAKKMYAEPKGKDG